MSSDEIEPVALKLATIKLGLCWKMIKIVHVRNSKKKPMLPSICSHIKKLHVFV